MTAEKKGITPRHLSEVHSPHHVKGEGQNALGRKRQKAGSTFVPAAVVLHFHPPPLLRDAGHGAGCGVVADRDARGVFVCGLALQGGVV
jgi:hypothetical protein